MTTTTYQTFRAGQKVRDIFGRTHIVAEQFECCVYFRGESGWAHPANLFAVEV